MKCYVNIPEEKIRLLKRKKWIERIKSFLKVEIKTNDQVEIEGDSLDVLKAREIIKAIGRGFNLEDALNLLDDDYRLEIIEISPFAGKSRSRKIELKGRVIGREGKMKKIIENFTNTKIAVYGKTVSIIGRWDSVLIARKAIQMLLEGAMHQTVYRFLEENRV